MRISLLSTLKLRMTFDRARYSDYNAPVKFEEALVAELAYAAG